VAVNHSEHATPTVSAGANPRWLKDLKISAPSASEAADLIASVELFDGATNKTLGSTTFSLQEAGLGGYCPPSHLTHFESPFLGSNGIL
jgi:hypothetical protein